jgi:membrane fusion protein, copper/silver efflux system
MNLKIVAVAAGVAGALVIGFFAGRAGHAPPAAPTADATTTAAQGGEKKILYYRNPMGLPDTSPTPKKDSMGMDYIPVYEGEDQDGSAVKISADRIQMMGVRTEPVAKRVLARTVNAVGTIEIDERGQHTVSPKFEGWIERLHVNTTGQAVARGQPLAEVYSPELVSAQREYLIAYNATKAMSAAGVEAQTGVKQLAEASLERLRNWDISEQQLARLRDGGEPRRTLTLVAPASGVIIKDPPVAGMRFMPGEPLFRIADLSRVWMVGDVFEQDLALLKTGTKATLTVSAFPDRSFPGVVTFVYPTLNAETRTARVRVELQNPQRVLKPGMYGSVEIAAGPKTEVLVVPDSAVIDSGARQAVLVALGGGRFEPREVKLGARGDGQVEVLSGVKEGESVVTRANFLIDSESNLRAALAGFAADKGASAQAIDAPAMSANAAEGTLVEINLSDNVLLLDHDPIPSLNWPRMEMEFSLGKGVSPKGLKPGDRVRFDMTSGKPGEFIVTKIEPLAAAPKPVKKADPTAPRPDAHKH